VKRYTFLARASGVPVLIDQFKRKYKAHNPINPILPKTCWRGPVRGFALINTADFPPLIVQRIRNCLANVQDVDEAGRIAWIRHWLGAGLRQRRVAGWEEPGLQLFATATAQQSLIICLATQGQSSAG
jgi:hypothetical protein